MDDIQTAKKIVSALLIVPADKAFADTIRKLTVDNENPLIRMANHQIERKIYDNELFDLMLGMSSFGIASMPDAKNPGNAVMLSQSNDSFVQGFVDRDQIYINNLVRINNLGIRPGLSGSVLFGVPFSKGFLDRYYFEEQRVGFSLPVELLPKIVLGMIVKTRLNGAETVALSLGDIYDFLEKQVLADNLPPMNELNVVYKLFGSEEKPHLKSSILLRGPNRPFMVEEYCSEEYKNSADFLTLDNKNLKKIFEEKKSEGFSKSLLSAYDDVKAKKEARELLKKIDPNYTPPKGSINKIGGGGEYGEGSDGFGADNARFLTSTSLVGKFKEEGLNFKALDFVSSFGLYLTDRSCKARGLKIGNKLIHAVKLPGSETVRMISFEDLRRFAKIYGNKTGALLDQYGFESSTPFFTGELESSETIKVSLLTGPYVSSLDKQWSPGGKQYFNQRLIGIPKDKMAEVMRLAEGTTTRPSGILIGKNDLWLDIDVTLLSNRIGIMQGNPEQIGRAHV